MCPNLILNVRLNVRQFALYHRRIQQHYAITPALNINSVGENPHLSQETRGVDDLPSFDDLSVANVCK